MTVATYRPRRGGLTTRRLATIGLGLAVAGAISLAGCSHAGTPTPYSASTSPSATAPPASASSATARTVTPVPAATATGSAAASTGTSSTATFGLQPVRIAIPSLHVNAPLVRLGLTSRGALAVPTKAMTAGWYTGSPVPGRVGPAVIAGHVHWSGIPAVFAHLADLRRGDRIVVTRSDGTTAAFTVDRVATYPKSRFPTALVYGSIDVAGLRLITCGGFDPVARTYEANVIAFATLTRS